MGGLSKMLPKTHLAFLIGVLALSGIPPFATFFSKDLILEQEYLAGYNILFYVGLVASILTAVYMTRAYYLTFRGVSRLDFHTSQIVREAPKIMLIPVGVLASLTVIGGFFGYTFSQAPLLENFLKKFIKITSIESDLKSGFTLTPETCIAITGAILGIGATAFIYHRYFNHLSGSWLLLKNQFYINKLYHYLLIKPLETLSYSIIHFFEPKVFNALISGPMHISQEVAQKLQLIQSGQIRSYIAWLILGFALFVAYFVFL